MTVHRKLASFEGRSSMRTWICGIAFRHAQNYRKRRHIRVEVLTEPPALAAIETGSPQVERLSAKQELAAVLHALEGLDSKLRDVFVLSDVEGLEMNEVVSIVRCPRFTGYTRLRSARKQLRQQLARQGFGREAHD